MLFASTNRKPSQNRIARLTLETLETRLTPYSVSGNAWPRPELITIGFVPDGTIVGADVNGYIYSNLHSTFNARFGSASAWQNVILRAAQVWAQQTNINFTVITDNGAEIGSGDYQQGDPSMADIRIGGYDFASSTLGVAALPPPVNNFSVAGDIQFNIGTLGGIGTTRDLFTVASHEIGHALGLNHASLTTATMFGTYNNTKSSLTADDISGIQAIYGGVRSNDALDTLASNNTSATATNITASLTTATKTALLTNMNIASTSDVDFYKFTVPTGLGGTLTARAQSGGLSLLANTLIVYNSSMTQLASNTASGTLGGTATVSVALTAGQTYYIRVSGAVSTTSIAPFNTGTYALSLGFAGVATPSVPLPDTRTLNGGIIQGGGGQTNRSPESAMLQADLEDRLAAAELHSYGPEGCACDHETVVHEHQEEDECGCGTCSVAVAVVAEQGMGRSVGAPGAGSAAMLSPVGPDSAELDALVATLDRPRWLSVPTPSIAAYTVGSGMARERVTSSNQATAKSATEFPGGATNARRSSETRMSAIEEVNELLPLA